MEWDAIAMRFEWNAMARRQESRRKAAGISNCALSSDRVGNALPGLFWIFSTLAVFSEALTLSMFCSNVSMLIISLQFVTIFPFHSNFLTYILRFSRNLRFYATWSRIPRSLELCNSTSFLLILYNTNMNLFVFVLALVDTSPIFLHGDATDIADGSSSFMGLEL